MESELSVRDALTKEYVGVNESDTVLSVVRLLRRERSSCALVLRGAEPVGIVTEWDVLDLVAEEGDPAETTVDEVMSTPVETIGADRSLTGAADVMTRQKFRNLVVEDEDGLLGVLTQRDVIAVAGSFQPTTMASPGQAVSTTSSAGADEERVPSSDEYTTQGVCEACGSLAESLFESNGQLLCADCRTV